MKVVLIEHFFQSPVIPTTFNQSITEQTFYLLWMTAISVGYQKEISIDSRPPKQTKNRVNPLNLPAGNDTMRASPTPTEKLHRSKLVPNE